MIAFIRSFLSVTASALITLASVAQAQEIGPVARNYEEVRSFMYQLKSEFPGAVELFDLGVADDGRTIEGMKIGKGPVKNLVVAAHHGNEYGSVEVARGLALSLAEAPIQGQTVYVIPVLNAWGFDRRSRNETANGRRHDPNRDYPGPCGTAGPFRLKSTSALAGFIEREGIVAAATLHTYYPAVVYPWGFTTHDLSTPYDDLFIELAKAATHVSNYPIGNATKVIYPANGTFEDWAFWAHGVWSLLFEVGHSHSPGQSAVDQMVLVNVPGLRRMLEQAPTVRAENHAFTGQCDRRLLHLDLHAE